MELVVEKIKKGSKAPGPGVYSGVSFDDYITWPYINHSLLRHLRRSPAHMKVEMESKAQPTDVQREGTILHELVVEPHLRGKYLALPEEEILGKIPNVEKYKRPKSTKAWKDAVKEFTDKNPGKVIVPKERMQELEEISRRVIEHLVCLKAEKRYNEVSMVWQDEDTGIHCKGRIDQLGVSENGKPCWIFDIKKHDDRCSFQEAIYKRGYHSQMAFYRSGLSHFLDGRMIPVHVMCIETTKPYTIQCAPMSGSCLHMGMGENHDAIFRVSDCIKSGNWPGPESPSEWELPERAYRAVTRTGTYSTR